MTKAVDGFPVPDEVPVDEVKAVLPDAVAQAKPLADTLMAKADTLYIGDSGVDMETARRACIDSVGVTWGFRSKKELVEYHADVIVNNPIDILDIVENGIRIS